jgi:hypothetical protein
MSHCATPSRASVGLTSTSRWAPSSRRRSVARRLRPCSSIRAMRRVSPTVFVPPQSSCLSISKTRSDDAARPLSRRSRPSRHQRRGHRDADADAASTLRTTRAVTAMAISLCETDCRFRNSGDEARGKSRLYKLYKLDSQIARIPRQLFSCGARPCPHEGARCLSHRAPCPRCAYLPSGTLT